MPRRDGSSGHLRLSRTRKQQLRGTVDINKKKSRRAKLTRRRVDYGLFTDE